MSEATKQPGSRPVPPPIPEAAQLQPVLTELPRWLIWRYEWKDGDWAKMPESPVTGERKGWPDATVTFDEARAGALKREADGLGFNPIAADGFVFLDFDDCIVDGTLDPEVALWLRHFPGYVEVTPSGTGLRVVVRGRLARNVTNHPLPGSRVGSSVELYSGKSNHFVTITGNPWGEPDFEISDAQLQIEKFLKYINFDAGSEEASGETTEEAAVRYFERNCKVAETLVSGRYVFLVRVCWWLGRVLGAEPKNPILTFENIKDKMEAAISKTGWEELRHIEGQLIAGQRKPIKLVVDEHEDALHRIQAWLASEDTPNPKHEDAYDDLAQLSEEEYARFRRDAAKRLGRLKLSMLDGFVRKRRVASTHLGATTVATNMTADQVRKALSDLLLTTQDERAALGLPESIEKASEVAENGLWQYITENAQTFSTASGQGYLLFHMQKELPIPVTHDGKELSAFLSNLGIHPGAASRNRIGKFIGNQCYRHGVRVEPRITFHYDPVTFSGYFSERPGKLIRITSDKIERIDNGTDGQLFLTPETFEPWTLDLDNLPEPTNLNPDAFALLPELLFDVLEFENESLCREDIEVLLNGYIATLELPGVVAGKILLQILGASGSGKTLFYECWDVSSTAKSFK